MMQPVNHDNAKKECATFAKPDDILISIKPIWCELIFSGEKTVEIRKTKPMRITDAVNVYIYETGNTGIVGRFRLRYFTYIQAWEDEVTGEKHLANTVFLKHCIDELELFDYLHKGRQKPGSLEPYPGGWAWHIEDLVKFDKPKPLSSFGLKRPPQSWCYVKHMETTIESETIK